MEDFSFKTFNVKFYKMRVRMQSVEKRMYVASSLFLRMNVRMKKSVFRNLKEW